ncbi:HtaA domain-containing protein [Nocardia sp. NPDC057668]|uniref:HtaA domain-containing protein n=1 Tax=Nocardia sp. NPDC057668 TaxID=3346202 RepID=UPI00366ABCCF
MSTVSLGRIRNRLAAAALAVVTAAGVGAVTATPSAADPSPSIELFTADGKTPLSDTVVHPGDKIVVRGTGFDPSANTDGLPVPVPPGVPHGTFVTFGGFAPDWRPSAGAPGASRGVNRSAVQWIMGESALNQVPRAPFDLQRTIRNQWVPLASDGTFTAVIDVVQPTKAPADAVFGVYTYAAAESVNPSQELAVPVRYDPAPGPNTPKPPAADLTWAVAPGFADTVTGPLQGSMSGRDGAAVRDKALTFELDEAAIDPATGLGELRYRGTVIASTRFHLGEIALADPWIEFTSSGTWLTAETSTSDTIGADDLRRIRVARLDAPATSNRTEWSQVSATFEPVLTPASLQLYAGGATAPLSFRY